MKNNTHSRKGSDEMYQNFETIVRWTEDLKACGTLDPALYDTYGVKRGLRDKNGKGVVAGLTGISQVQGKKVFNGESVPCQGQLHIEMRSGFFRFYGWSAGGSLP